VFSSNPSQVQSAPSSGNRQSNAKTPPKKAMNSGDFFSSFGS
jgi:hypothetical protein